MLSSSSLPLVLSTITCMPPEPAVGRGRVSETTAAADDDDDDGNNDGDNDDDDDDDDADEVD